tara:strand:- start:169 stop:399 length:231 start_codon:yes stop_codon:yes gene_type:complete
MTNLTKAQRIALQKLESTTLQAVVKTEINRYVCDLFHTGINTTTLYSLRDKGLIQVKFIFLGGATSTDLKIIKLKA